MSFLSPLCVMDLGSSVTRSWFGEGEKIRKEQTQGLLVENGRINDDLVAGAFINAVFLRGGQKRASIVRPRLALSVPCVFTRVEREAFARAAVAAGVSGLKLISASLCAASGAGVDLTSAKAVVMVACGAQFSSLSVLVSGAESSGMELSLTTKTFSERLCARLKKDLQVTISPKIMAGFVATHLGLKSDLKDLHIPGKNSLTGKAMQVVVPKEVLNSETEAFLKGQAEKIQVHLNRLSSAYAGDILEQGVLLYGGFAQLPGLSLFLASVLKIPVSVVPEPELCVINGLKEIASSISVIEFTDEIDGNNVLGC